MRRNEPIVAHAGRDDTDGIGVDGIGAVGLVFDREWAELIARREEYDPAKFLELIALADAAGAGLGEFLLAIARRSAFDLLAYRIELCRLLGYTSPGYIFHPVPLADGRVAVAAIGSGYEGSGDPAVPSKRHELGMDRLLSMREAMEVRSFRRVLAGRDARPGGGRPDGRPRSRDRLGTRTGAPFHGGRARRARAFHASLLARLGALRRAVYRRGPQMSRGFERVGEKSWT